MTWIKIALYKVACKFISWVVITGLVGRRQTDRPRSDTISLIKIRKRGWRKPSSLPPMNCVVSAHVPSAALRHFSMAPMTLSLVSPLRRILAWAMAASGLYFPFFSCEHDSQKYVNACGKGLSVCMFHFQELDGFRSDLVRSLYTSVNFIHKGPVTRDEVWGKIKYEVFTTFKMPDALGCGPVWPCRYISAFHTADGICLEVSTASEPRKPTSALSN